MGLCGCDDVSDTKSRLFQDAEFAWAGSFFVCSSAPIGDGRLQKAGSARKFQERDKLLLARQLLRQSRGEKMANLTRTTRDHDEIRRWAEERGGKPSHVQRTGSGEDVGILRIDFPGYSGEGSLEPITWEQWFEKFDEQDLSLVYEEETAGGARSNFNKLVSAATAAEAEAKSHGRTGGGTGRRKSASKKARKADATRSAGAKKSAAQKSAAKKNGAKKSAKTAARGAARKVALKKTANKKTTAKGAKKSAAKKTAAKKRR